MIYLTVFGGIALILAIFYLLNSIQSYHTWRFATLLVVIFALATGYGAIHLPAQHRQAQQQAKKAAVSQKKNSSQTKAAQQSSLTKAASTFNPTGTVINGETESQKSAARANAEQQMTKQLGTAFANFGKVTFATDSKTYTITPTNADTVKALEALEATPSQAEQAQWPTLTENFRKSSANVSKSLQADYTITLVSPDQDGKVLYSAKNGQTVTDFTK